MSIELTSIPNLVRFAKAAAELAATDLRIASSALGSVSYATGELADESEGEVQAIRSMLFLKYFATDPEGGMQSSYSPISRVGGLRAVQGES